MAMLGYNPTGFGMQGAKQPRNAAVKPTYMTSPGRYPGNVQRAYGSYQRTNQPVQRGPVAQTAQPQAPINTGYAAPAPPAPIDYSSDPILQQIIAGGNEALTGGKARMLRDQKQALLAFGSRDLARKLLGEDPFVDTVSDDPFTSMSALGLSRRQEMDDTRNTNEGLNKMNLFFSSERGDQLADVTRQRLLRDATSTNQFQSQLTSFQDVYAQLQEQVRQQRMQAEQEAYQRAIEAAIQSAYGGMGAQEALSGGLSQATVNQANAGGLTPFPLLPGANPILAFK
jgi:hypothetical protein